MWQWKKKIAVFAFYATENPSLILKGISTKRYLITVITILRWWSFFLSAYVLRLYFFFTGWIKNEAFSSFLVKNRWSLQTYCYIWFNDISKNMKVSRSVVVKIFITHDKLLSHYSTYFYVTLQHSNRIRNAGRDYWCNIRWLA